MKTAIAIRHVHFEDLGAMAYPIRAAGYRVRYCDAGVDDLATVELKKADLIVVLGGPIGAYEADAYPFLTREIGIIEARIAARQPVLGICLGAQLIARALGTAVYAAPEKEIGWSEIELTREGERGPLAHLHRTMLLHWHGDTFDLPRGTTLLASTVRCRNQAFSFGSNILGIQFHPEVDGRRFERWLIGHAVEIAATPGLSLRQLRHDTACYGAMAGARGRACVANWLAAAEPR